MAKELIAIREYLALYTRFPVNRKRFNRVRPCVCVCVYSYNIFFVEVSEQIQGNRLQQWNILNYK